MKAYVINGRGGAGKDQFVTYVREALITKYMTPTSKVINISSVAEIKEIAQQYFGWDGETKTPKWRKALSDLKDIQTRMCDGPFLYMVRQFEDSKDSDGVIFFHIREPAEIEKFVKETSASTIFVRRPGADAALGNHADDQVENYRYNHVVINDGTLEDFRGTAENFVKNEIKS
jgi:hypothetical protein